MDTKPLKLFLSLSETLHFGRSSALCHVSPSTLSRTIKQIEDQLGTTLFYRDNRSVKLTPEGVLFQNYARETLQRWESLQNSLLAEGNELQGEISLYCSVTASYSFLYEILNRFRRLYPKIEIKLHTGDPAHAVQRVQREVEDIAIGARPDQLASDIAFRPITISPLVFIGPAQDQTMTQDLSGLADASHWSQIPMILSEEGLARKRTDHWFRSLGIKPLIYAQVAGNEAIVSMVSLGFGIGIVPLIVLENSPLADRVHILSVTPELPPFEVGLFALEKKLKSPLIQAFWSESAPESTALPG